MATTEAERKRKQRQRAKEREEIKKLRVLKTAAQPASGHSSFFCTHVIHYDPANFQDIPTDGYGFFHRIKQRVIKSLTISRRLERVNVNKKNSHLKEDRDSCRLVDIDHWSIGFNVEGVKVPWFVVQRSSIEDAGLGLFAARNFCKGEIIGFYMGKPDKTSFDASTEYSIKADFGIVHSSSIKYGNLITMGLQMANDPTFSKDASPQDEDEFNFVIHRNMMAEALRDIEVGEEMFLKYNREPPKSNY